LPRIHHREKLNAIQMPSTQKIITFLWFNGNAEQAVKFHTSVFKNSKITKISRQPEAVAKYTGQPPGSIMTIAFTLNGQDFMAVNGGPQAKFTQAISLMVYCDTQAELNRYWKKLTSGGGKAVACGWLQDKYGLSWQIAPKEIIKLLSDQDPAKVERVMHVVMDSVKLDIKKLQAAAMGKTSKFNDFGTRNFNMPEAFVANISGNYLWPISLNIDTASGLPNWHHSNMREVAYPYLYLLYDQFVGISNQ
jgi:predicted 3-demethylubiquinone-9 3-methyltransferase (glyoxalase superfamily)